MNDLWSMFVPLCVFLLTYLVHSTLAVAGVGVLLLRRQWVADAELRLLMWKMALVLPVITAAGVTWIQWPHFGWQLALLRTEPPVSMEMPSDSSSEESYGEEASTASVLLATDERRLPTAPVAARPVSGTGEGSVGQSARSGLFCSNSLIWPLIVFIWGVAATCRLIGLIRPWIHIVRLRKAATVVTDADTCSIWCELKSRFGVRRPVELLSSRQVRGPLTAGILRPFVLLPAPYAQSADLPDRQALLAHELAHVVRRDAVWNLVIQVVCRVFPFQPLNGVAGRRLRQEMDFVADRVAAGNVIHRDALVRWLLHFGDQLAGYRERKKEPLVLAACMATFRSALGQRIEVLLETEPGRPGMSRLTGHLAIAFMLSSAITAAFIAPRVVAQSSVTSVENPENLEKPPLLEIRNQSMNMSLSSLVVFLGLSGGIVADEPVAQDTAQKSRPVAAGESKKAPDPLPAGIKRFNGMLVGKLLSKDVEKGSFVLQVDAVPRVWKNSAAEDPKCLVGKTIEVSGVFGRFLDVLVVTRAGETIEFECKHDGERLVFPGELLRKTAPFKPEDYPELPEEFRGFKGTLAAEVIKKDAETFELIIQVTRVVGTADGSTAKKPQSIEGRQLMLAGFWNRKDAYHSLKVGDRMDVKVQHIGLRSDHLTVSEFVRAGESKPDSQPAGKGRDNSEEGGFSRQLRGFRGMLVGRLVEKDVERGTFTITVDAVPRVWNNNEASQPKSFLGSNVAAEGVSGKMLDTLVVTRVGETVEFGARHDDGSKVRVMEVLRKVAPVKPGDYPELPDGFRGFKGVVVAKIVRKNEPLLDLIVEVRSIKAQAEGSKAKNAASMIGQQAMLAGFWQRKEVFHDLAVGDVIEFGVEHPQLLSDHLTVVESVKKLETK